MVTMWDSIPDALVAREAERARSHEIGASIFRLKRDYEDGKIDDDAFDDSRMSLNGELRASEAQIAYIDAWIAEVKHARAAANVAQQAEAQRAAEERRAEVMRKNLAMQERAIAAKERRNAETERLALALKSLLAAVVAKDGARTTQTIEQIRAAFPGLVEAAERGELRGALRPAHTTPPALATPPPAGTRPASR